MKRERMLFDVVGDGWCVVSDRRGEQLRVRFELRGNRLLPVELKFPHGLTGPELRAASSATSGAETYANSMDYRDAVLASIRHEPIPDVKGPARVSAKVQKPDLAEGERYPDSFYERVAAIYRYYSLRGESPAQAMATANAVPISTAHRWLKEARRRGILVNDTVPGRLG